MRKFFLFSCFPVFLFLALFLSCNNSIIQGERQDNHDLVELESTQLSISTLENNKDLIEANILATYSAGAALFDQSVYSSISEVRSVSAGFPVIPNDSITQEQKEILDILIEDFYSSLPEPPMIFHGEIPSGCYEDDRYIYIAGITIDKLDPDKAAMLVELAKCYEDESLGNVEANDNILTTNISRGIYLDNVSKWPGGVVTVVRDTNSISTEDWRKIMKSFNQWTVKSNNSVTFKEITPSVWDWFLWGLSISRFVNVTIQPESFFVSGAAAYTNCLGNGAWATLTIINTAWASIKDKQYSIDAIVGHEMGHILGLNHEHQRPDRDRYVIIAPKPAEWMQIQWDHNMGKLSTKYFLWWKLYAPVSVGPFDYSSIMLYPSPYVKKLDGSEIFTNFTVSSTDGATIDQLY